jgi:nitrilase
MDSRPGVHTIYNTLLFIERTGKILGRHRKTVPTFVERAIWGPGDGTDLITYETDIGRIGGLICGEHLMPLIRARMIEQGEDFHISVFPGAFSLHTGPKLEEPDLEGRFFWGHTLTRAHAMEAGAFVLSACGYMTSGDLPPDFPLRETVNLDYAHGGSQIVAPLGIPLVPPTLGDAILYAECPADMIKVWKAIIDTVGHYARPDIVRLQYMKSAEPSMAQLAAEALEKKSPDDLEAIAERQGLGRRELETAIERLAR